MVDQLQLFSDSHKYWNVNFIGAVTDWEVDFFTLFFNLLYSIRSRQGDEDKLCWALSKRGLFDVRLFYNFLIPHDDTPFPLE